MIDNTFSTNHLTNRWGDYGYEDFLFGDVVPLYWKRGTELINTDFKIGEPVYIKETNAIGFVINGPTNGNISWGSEVRTDTDGVRCVSQLEPFKLSHLEIEGVYNPYQEYRFVMEYLNQFKD